MEANGAAAHSINSGTCTARLFAKREAGGGNIALTGIAYGNK